MFRLLRPFDYHEPGSIDEAVAQLAALGRKAKIIAGGTDLIIAMKKRRISPEHLVSLGRIPDLDRIRVTPEGGLKLGPTATHAAIAASPLVKKHFPMLATACNEVGTPQVRNMGTIGGNLCMAGPSQDTPPVLVALEACLKLVCATGERIVPLHRFCTDAFCTVLGADELITEIEVPPMPAGGIGCYRWCTKVSAVDETLAGAGVVLVCDGKDQCRDVRIGLGSVAPVAIRAREAVEILRGRELNDKLIDKAAATAAAEAEPRSRADYRRHMIRVLVRDAVRDLHRQIQASQGEGAP